MNEWWKHVADRERLEMQNETDKKQEFLYGRSCSKLNIICGRLKLEIMDPQAILVDRYVNPWDLESGRRITHTGIFMTPSQECVDAATPASNYRAILSKVQIV
jgi:hypothetical protein